MAATQSSRQRARREEASTLTDSHASQGPKNPPSRPKSLLKPLGVRLIQTWAEAVGIGPVITPHDATELRSYFRSMGGAGPAAGSQFEREALYAGKAIPCKRCGGDTEKLIGGTGWMPSQVARRQPTATEQALLDWERKKANKGLPPRADVPCTNCDGRGWVRGSHRYSWHQLKMFWVSRRHLNGISCIKWQGPFTQKEAEQAFEDLSCEYDEVCMAKASAHPILLDAQPSGSSVPLGCEPVDDASIAVNALIARRLDDMSKVWEPSVEVLDSWFGDGGGKLSSLWTMTAAGKTLLRRNRVRNLDPQRFFQNERDDAREKHDRRRLKLFDTADEQSSELLETAGLLWNLTRREDISYELFGKP